MKKIILLCVCVCLLTGCVSIKKDNLNNIIQKALNSHVKVRNVNRNGYRYYIPRGLNITTSNNFNEIITNNQYSFYLYVDIVSYNNKTNFAYNINNKAYYSEAFSKDDKKGFIEINNYKKDKYIIEIMYNYAKIEVVGYEEDINNIVAYAIVILSSITYNDSVIANYLSNKTYNTTPEEFNIFEIIGSDNYLQFAEEEDSKEDNKDPDYIK